MGREIVYSEARPGVFEPAPSPYQRRKAKRQAAAKAERRSERLNAIGMVAVFGVMFALIAVGDLIAFGGGIGPGSAWAKLMAWLA